MKHYQPLGIYVAGGELRCFTEISAYLFHVFRERCLQNSTVQCFIGNSHNAHSLHTSPYNNTAGRVFFHPRTQTSRGKVTRGSGTNISANLSPCVCQGHIPTRGGGWERGRNARAEVLIMRASSQGGLSVVIRDSLSHSSEGLNGVMA